MGGRGREREGERRKEGIGWERGGRGWEERKDGRESG